MNFPVILGCDVDANVELIMTVGQRNLRPGSNAIGGPGTVRCLTTTSTSGIDVPAIDESLAVAREKTLSIIDEALLR